MKEKPPPLPPPLGATRRRQILACLDGPPLSARELSALVGLPEKEIYGHLEHIRRSQHHQPRRLHVVPAACRQCGFTFGKREKLTCPSRCPRCKEESVTEPLFALDPERG